MVLRLFMRLRILEIRWSFVSIASLSFKEEQLSLLVNSLCQSLFPSFSPSLPSSLPPFLPPFLPLFLPHSLPCSLPPSLSLHIVMLSLFLQVWATGADGAVHSPPTDIIWKSVSNWGCGPRTSTSLCTKAGEVSYDHVTHSHVTCIVIFTCT